MDEDRHTDLFNDLLDVIESTCKGREYKRLTTKDACIKLLAFYLVDHLEGEEIFEADYGGEYTKFKRNIEQEIFTSIERS